MFQDISGDWGGDGRLFQITGGAQNVTIDHNTAFQTGFIMVFDNGTSYNVNYTNNISNVGWGVVGNGSAEGTSTMYAYMGGGQLSGNVLIGGNANRYPAGNYFPGSVDQVGFVDFNGGNFALNASSPYAGAGASAGSHHHNPYQRTDNSSGAHGMGEHRVQEQRCMS